MCILAYAVFFKRASNGPVKDINSENIVTVLFFFVFLRNVTVLWKPVIVAKSSPSANVSDFIAPAVGSSG
jgi:hypothetical protein